MGRGIKYSTAVLNIGVAEVVSLTSLQLYPLGYSDMYLLDRRLGRPEIRSGIWRREKSLASGWN
jgi:hypothetical protein